VVIVTDRPANIPRVPPQDRITVDDLAYTDDDITHVTARFGFQDDPDIPGALRLATEKALEYFQLPDRRTITMGWQTPL
jgi:KUP system potassium uptake protein